MVEQQAVTKSLSARINQQSVPRTGMGPPFDYQ